MPRFFNTTGPCRADEHYMLPAAERLAPLRRTVERSQYAVVHAARQSGKTTSLYAFAAEVLAAGQVAALVVSCEVGSSLATLEQAEPALLAAWRIQASLLLPLELQPPAWPDAPPGSRILAALTEWARACPRPLVLFLDEFDSLRDGVVLSLLRQLRAGFPHRPTGFPRSIVLVGMRDVRDYLDTEGERLGAASPFNIKVDSLGLRDFSAEEVAALLAQHTADTGQRFTAAAVERIYHFGRGQPWITSALAALLTDVSVPDRSDPIDDHHVDAAARALVVRRDTHLDSLVARAEEERVRRVLEPVVAGLPLERVPEDDRQYVVDLGLVRRSPEGGLELANPIYENVLGRALASGPLDAMPPVRPTWLVGGRLVPERLLDAFLAFWKANAEPLAKAATYPEIAPHLVMMAFLDRVANGGGSVDREFAAGTGRIDLLLRYGTTSMAFELKAWRDRRRDPLQRGLLQLDAYLDRLSLSTGWLVIFDVRKRRAPVERRTAEELVGSPAGRDITLVRA